MKKVINKLEGCPRWDNCSINICPIDPEAVLKDRLLEEEYCPFTIKKKGKSQKGIRTLATDSVLEIIPESNIKMLNKRNQKRWYTLRQKDATR
ncbi:MAG: hypothetical protein HYW70_00295 [Candidatus Nealsonbacteria bacterium]|nr:hypothetical protein [Candidatus Nealsonbacteria bacterium]